MNSDFYFRQQKLLAGRRWYRRFWVWCGIYSILILFALGIYVDAIGQWRVVVLAIASFILARVIVSPLIYLCYKRVRPYQKFNFETFYSRLLSFKSKKSASFPSDHAISMAAICFIFIWFYPSWIWPLLILVVLNGSARVVLGYHYFSDVLAGWILGILSALAVIHWLVPLLFTR